MKVACIGLAALTLGGCATPAEPQTPTSGDGDDCAVIAAVAKEHYGFNATDRPSLPLWLNDGRGWAPRCDWSRHGLAVPQVYDPAATEPEPDGAPSGHRYVSFQKPSYDGQGAVIESSAMWGPWAGEGVRCRLRSGFAGWTVERCEQTWIS
ncbi:hypothetical protein [Brevundimonas sp.]|jgi:hypothetical protein|uniref:hypothetical protein n=1 Tax=Brevundimonas sp. TaxID=1871086 RepID=UPI002E13DE67|nr:hypothetical protein [Brevundimonas sp.]